MRTSASSPAMRTPATCRADSRRRSRRKIGAELITVQHHHAHLASVLAEHGRTDRVVGVICDGVGYGDDGTAWGGEILIADLKDYDRAARLRPLKLPGGDAAAKQTGRCAQSWLTDLLGDDAANHPATKFVMPDDAQRETVRGMLERGFNCPPSSGTGRLFDAAAALLGVTDYNRYEAMSGMMLEAAASRSTDTSGPDGVMRIQDSVGGLWRSTIGRCWRGCWRWMRRMGRRSRIAPNVPRGTCGRFYARGSAMRICERESISTVALSGGVFCNTLFSQLVMDRLASAGLDVLTHRLVSPSDGGLAYGQAAVSAAVLADLGQE
jgi:hydrogenase maturation protein HypF